MCRIAGGNGKIVPAVGCLHRREDVEHARVSAIIEGGCTLGEANGLARIAEQLGRSRGEEPREACYLTDCRLPFGPELTASTLRRSS